MTLNRAHFVHNVCIKFFTALQLFTFLKLTIYTLTLFGHGFGIGVAAAPATTSCNPTSPCAENGSLAVKNILYIIIDDLTADLSLFGGKIDQAPIPNLQHRLAPRAVNFLRAYAQQSVCGPSRNSFLSGRHPDETQSYTFKTSFRDTLPDAVSLPQAFKNAGYLTCGFGKTFHDDGIPSPPDYDNPYSWSPECPYYAPEEDFCGEGQHGWCTPDMPEGNFTDGLVVDAAIERLRGHVHAQSVEGRGDRPFFFAVGIRKPHLDWAVPKAYLDAQVSLRDVRLPSDSVRVAPPGMPAVAYYNCSTEPPWKLAMPEIVLSPHEPLQDELERELRRAYYAAVTWMDANVGKLLDALTELGLDENTAIVFHSDHGFHLSEEGMWCKQNTREIGTRVPLLVSAPGLTVPSEARREKEQRETAGLSEAIVQLVDIYPTLLDLAGLTLPDPNMRGRSLIPLMRRWGSGGNETENATGFGAAFSQYPRCASTSLAPSGLASQGYRWNRQCAWLENDKIDVMGYSVRVEGWRYTEWYTWEARRARPRWNAAGLVAVELYAMDMSRGKGVMEEMKMEDKVARNVANDVRYRQEQEHLSKLLYDHFSSFQPFAMSADAVDT